MKLRLAILALAAPLAFAQVNLAVPLAPNVYADLITHWLDYGKPLGVLNADISDSATTVVLTGVAAAPAVGASIAIRRDPCVITAATLNGSTLTLTVTRSTYALATPAAHAAGGAVTLLFYASPAAMFVSETVVPWAGKMSMGLGDRSVALTAAPTKSP